jgi:cytochrome P450
MMTRCTNNQYYGYITLEMKKFMHELLATPNNFYDLTNLFCSKVSSRLAYGSDESAPEHVTNADLFLHQIGPSGPVTNLMPFLRHLPEWLVPGKSAVRHRQEKEATLWAQLFDKTKTAYKKGNDSKTYVSAALETKQVGTNDKLLFENETEAKFAVGMLCIVGVFTVAGPAVLFIMAMVLHPEWQAKVRQQIDNVVGANEMLDLHHSAQLPILRAAIKECVRWKSTVPLGKSTHT